MTENSVRLSGVTEADRTNLTSLELTQDARISVRNFNLTPATSESESGTSCGPYDASHLTMACLMSVALTILIFVIFKACGFPHQPQLFRVRRRVKHRFNSPRSARRRSDQGVPQPKASPQESGLASSAPIWPQNVPVKIGTIDPSTPKWPQNVPVKIGTIDTSTPDNSGVDPTQPEIGVDPTEAHPSDRYGPIVPETLQPKTFWGPSECCPEPGTREHEIALALWQQQWENMQWLKEGGQNLYPAEQVPENEWGDWHNEIYQEPGKPPIAPIDEEWFPGSPGRQDHYVMHVYPSIGSGSLKFEKE